MVKTNNHLEMAVFRLFLSKFYLLNSTFVEDSLQISPFLTNEPNFQKVKLNITKALTKDYEKKDTWWSGKKQSQTNPNKANLPNAQMNVSLFATKDYENIANWAICENKPNSNPNKPNFKGKSTGNTHSVRSSIVNAVFRRIDGIQAVLERSTSECFRQYISRNSRPVG